MQTHTSFWMQHSLALAARAVGLANPNPAVGCVLVGSDGQFLGEGHTQAVGGPHAEVMALRDAQARGLSTHGASAYVTLEPCCHHGRTPPCSEALIVAGVAKVVAALADPNPLVSGQGFTRLREAGIEVSEGDGAEAAREINRGFLQRMTTGRPWLRAKVAASIDGFTALPNGQSQWITSQSARRDGQLWRQRADMVLTGIGTVLADDPSLNVRDWPTTRQPHLAIADSQLRTPVSARLWEVNHRQVVVLGQAADADDGRSHRQLLERQQALEGLGATVIMLPAKEGARMDMSAALAALAPWSANEIHVEAGATLNGALLAANLVDEWLLYLAPTLLGAGRAMAQRENPLAALAQAPHYRWLEQSPVGEDWRVRLIRRAEQSTAAPAA